jgi:hypothetical protein
LTGAQYIERIEAFAARLKADAAAMDEEGGVVTRWYQRFCAEGLHVGWSPRQPLTGLEFCRSLAALSRVSGSFAFVALQQFVANLSLAEAEAEEWPRVGVAFGHLRNPDGPAPILRDGVIHGSVPWMTGSGIFPQVLLGLRDEKGQEILALVGATDSATFQHSRPMRLVACTGTRTVRVDIANLPLDESQILAIRPPGSQARGDAESVLYQTPLLVGCVQACGNLIRESPLVGAEEKARSEAAQSDLLQRVFTAFSENNLADGPLLRAEIGDFAVRLARLAVMASGGQGLRLDHPAQRLYREALVYTLMAQTGDIVTQAFQSVMR